MHSTLRQTLLRFSGSFFYDSNMAAAAPTFIFTFQQEGGREVPALFVLWFRKANSSLGTTWLVQATWILHNYKGKKEGNSRTS